MLRQSVSRVGAPTGCAQDDSSARGKGGSHALPAHVHRRTGCGLRAGHAGRARALRAAEEVRAQQVAQNPAVRNTAESAASRAAVAGKAYHAVSDKVGDRVPDSVAERVRSLRDATRTAPSEDEPEGDPATPGRGRPTDRGRTRRTTRSAPAAVRHESWSMGIVAGLDSSSEFTRIVVCDTDTGAVLRQGYAPHPVRRGRRRPADRRRPAGLAALPRRGRGRRAAGGRAGHRRLGAAARPSCALDAQGSTRAARAWSATTSGRRSAAADLIDALGGRAAWAAGRGLRCRRPRSRWRSCAGWRGPSRTPRGAPPSVLQPHDWLVWQLLGRPARRTTDRGRRLRHRLLVGGDRRLPARSRRAGARPPGAAARGARPGRGRRDDAGGAADLGRYRRDHGRGLRARRRARRRGGLARRLRLGLRRAPRGAGRPHRHDHRRSPTPPACTCRSCTRSTRYGRCAAPPSCSGYRPGGAVRAGAEVHAGLARAGAAAVPGGRADAVPAAHRRDADRAAARVA